MRTLKTSRPGHKGTKELLARYGPSLLCVRYRFDDLTRERVKTVELVIQRRSGGTRFGAFSGAECRAPSDRTAASRAPVVVRTARGTAPLLRLRPAAQRVALRIHWGRPICASGSSPPGGRWDPHRPRLASPPRPRRAPRSPSPGGGRSRWVDVDTGWLDVDTGAGRQ